MFTNLKILNDATAMARHAASRQSVVSANIANANTPGYKAKDIKSFKDVVSQGPQPTIGMKATRPQHVQTVHETSFVQAEEDPSALEGPDGNTVSVEQQMLKSIDAERQHSRAVTIYQTSLGILRASIGNR